MNKPEGVTNLSDFRKNSAEQIVKFLSDLDGHNRDHGPGSQFGKSLGRAFSAMIDKKEPELDIQGNQAAVAFESAQEARASLGELRGTYDAVLARFGLILNHKTSEGLKHGVPGGELELRISDATPFIRYLQSIKADAEDEVTRNAFSKLAEVVVAQIQSVDFRHPSPATQGVIEQVRAISEALVRFGENRSTKRLAVYAKFQSQGKLEQFVSTERSGVWQEPGEGFGPADWIRDISAEHLEKKWSDVLAVLKSQIELQDAGLAEDLRAHLLMCLDRSLEILPTTSWNENTKNAFKEILNKYRSEIANT